MSTIASIDVRLFHVPLAEVLVDAKHGDHTHFELVTATIRLADGSEGTGYTYTGGKGGHAIRAMIEHDLAPFLIGRDATDVEALVRRDAVACALCRARRHRLVRDLGGRHRAVGPARQATGPAAVEDGRRCRHDAARPIAAAST